MFYYRSELKTKYNLLAFQRSFYLSEGQILKYNPIEKYSTTQTFKKIRIRKDHKNIQRLFLKKLKINPTNTNGGRESHLFFRSHGAKKLETI